MEHAPQCRARIVTSTLTSRNVVVRIASMTTYQRKDKVAIICRVRRIEPQLDGRVQFELYTTIPLSLDENRELEFEPDLQLPTEYFYMQHLS